MVAALKNNIKMARLLLDYRANREAADTVTNPLEMDFISILRGDNTVVHLKVQVIMFDFFLFRMDVPL